MTSIAFSHDGRRLYSVAIGETLRSWDVAEARGLHGIHAPGDGLLQPGRATQAMPDAIAEISQPVVAFGVGQRSIDEFVGGSAILPGEVRAEGSTAGDKASE